MNPLLDYSTLPRFDAFRPEHVAPAIDTLLAECRETVARLLDAQTPITWERFVQPLSPQLVKVRVPDVRRIAAAIAEPGFLERQLA